MAERWLAADLHLNHRALVEGFGDGRLGPRADHFATIEEHDEAILQACHDVVKPEDKFYILGDIALNRAGWRQAEKLPGKKRAVLGNHDQEKAKYLATIFQKLYGALVMDGMLLTHVPVHPLTLTRRSMQVNVHGHMHELKVPLMAGPDKAMDFDDLRYRCVSLEQIGFKPINVDDLIAELTKRGVLDRDIARWGVELAA